MNATDMILIFCGGGLGAVLRWGLSRLLKKHYHSTLPLGTLTVNVSGAFIFAFLSTLFHYHWHIRSGSPVLSFILTGVLGGYTAFSSLELDSVNLWGESRRLLSLFYLFSTTAGSLLSAGAGIYAAQFF